MFSAVLHVDYSHMLVGEVDEGGKGWGEGGGNKGRGVGDGRVMGLWIGKYSFWSMFATRQYV